MPNEHIPDQNVILHDDVTIDTPRDYEAVTRPSWSRRFQSVNEFLEEQQGFSPEQQREVEIEEEILGLRVDDNPERFLKTRDRLQDDMFVEASDELPGLKVEIIERTAAYFARGDETTRRQLTDMLSSRLAKLNVVDVVDPLADPKTLSGGQGRYDSGNKIIYISFFRMLQAMHNSKDMDEYHEVVRNKTLAHEVLHAVFTHGRHEDDTYAYTVRNGLQLSPSVPDSESDDARVTYGRWINEGTLESFRQTIMESPPERTSYEPERMILGMLDELSPGLRDRQMLAAITGQGPGQAFVEIENLLGPTAIDDVEVAITRFRSELVDNSGTPDEVYGAYDSLKATIASMLPSGLRARGASALDRQEESVIGHLEAFHEWHTAQRTKAGSGEKEKHAN